MKFKAITIYLIALFVVAFFLRSFLIEKNLFFGPEQGIDFLVIKDLVINHKFTLIGAKTDVSGVFHGPIYYYLGAVPFLLSNGDPVFIALFFILINSLTVFFIYLLGKAYFNTRVGLIAALLFTVSFNAIVYSRWLSTHPLSIPLVCLFFLFLYKFLKGNKKSLLWVAVMFGLLSQAEFLNLLFYSATLLFIMLLFLNKIKKTNIFYLIFCAFIGTGLAVGSFVLFDLRHELLISNSILSLIQQERGFHESLTDTLFSIGRAYSSMVETSVTPFLSFSALLIIFFSTFFLIKESKKGNKYIFIILLWLFTAPLLLIPLKHGALDQFFVTIIPVVLLVTAFLIDQLWKKSAILAITVLSILLYLNIAAWLVSIPSNQNMFFKAPQPQLTYKDELAVIDEIYQDANGKPFSIQAYTIPYWTQQGWQYLFWSYGEKKYGYFPVAEKAPLLYVIVQDDPGREKYQKQWLKDTVSKWGNLKETYKFGILTVRKLEVIEE